MNIEGIKTRKDVEAAMAMAIFSGTGAKVEATLARANMITISGEDAEVIKARVVMVAAGCSLDDTATDEDLPGERFDYWIHA